MAHGINITALPLVNSLEATDLILVDRPVLGTKVVQFSSVKVTGDQVSFYTDFVTVSSLATNSTTFISGGVSPSGSIVPTKAGILYLAANTQDLFVSVGTLTNKDWKRILTVNY